MRRVRKAFCYITRDDGRLLVFTYQGQDIREAGFQVPAGTVRDGEDVREAARREAVEETGLDELSAPILLGATDWDFRPARDELHERHFFHLAAGGDVPETWTWQETHDGLAPPTPFDLFWIPLESAHVLSGGHSAFVGTLAERLALARP